MTFPRVENPATSARRAVGEAAPRRSDRVKELQGQLERLMTRMRVAVIFGGDKSVGGAVINPTFNPRSWKSYQAVAEDIAAALTRIGFRHVQLIPDDMRLGGRLRSEGIHMAWLNTGGVQGYSPMSHAPAMLEMFGVPYVGHDPLTASMLDNKHAFKQCLKALNLPTAPFVTWNLARGPFRPETNDLFKRTFGDYAGPFVVKPVSGRASLHVHLVEKPAALSDIVAEVFTATENHVLIETYLPGREYCIAVCGSVIAQRGKLTRLPEPFIFAAVERLLEPDEKIVTSMDVRPITSDRMRVLDPDTKDADLRELQDLARRVFIEFNLDTVVRLDARADATGKLFILEVNPKPDLKAPTKDKTSLVCGSLAPYGMSYEDLILSLLADCLDLYFSQRRDSVTNLRTLLE